MVMVMMIACGILVLFLYTPSSIILVYLTLRLHFVAHYGGRGRWFKRGIIELQKYASKNERAEGGRSSWACGHLWFTVITFGLLVVLNLLWEI